MKIIACPRCGSGNIDVAGVRDGTVPAEVWKKVCKKCGWTGSPLEFDSEKDYQKFLEHLKKSKKID